MPAGSKDAPHDGFVVVSRQNLGREAWDAVAEESDDAWLWHVDAFAEALETWDGANDASFALLSSEGRPAAIMPVTIYSMSRARGLMHVSHIRSLGGPALAPWVVGKQRDRVRAAAVAQAMTLAEHHRGISFQITLPPLAPGLRGERCPRISPLADLGLNGAPSQTWIVDLRAGADVVWHGMKDRARGEIRKAERAGVRFRVATGLDDLDRYFALHVDTYRRTGADPHPYAYFEYIWRELMPSGRAIMFGAELDGKLIAARNFALFKAAGMYWTGAASDQGMTMGAGALVQWQAMSWLAEHGYEWSETGESFPGSRDPKSRGLSLHKASFGGELYPLFRAGCQIPRRSYDALAALKSLRAALSRRELPAGE